MKYPWSQYSKEAKGAFRVVWYAHAPYNGCGNWDSYVRVFESAEDAVAAAKELMGCAFQVTAQAINGRSWKTLYKRDRRKKSKQRPSSETKQ